MESKRSVELACVALAMLAGAILFTWPLTLHLAGRVPSPGDSLPNAWILAWVAERTAHGLAGVWNAPILFPYLNTLSFGEPLLGIAIPLAPLSWLGANPLLLHNVAVLASFVIAGTGGYLLGRDLTGHRGAGAVCGAIAAFLPYRTGHVSHVQVLMAAWLWWVMWAVHQYFARPTLARALRLALLFVLLGLSSLYWVYAGGIAVAIVATIEALRRKGPVKTWVIHGLAASAVCAVAFAPVAMSMQAQRSDEGETAAASRVDAQSYSANVLSYVSGQATLNVWGGLLRKGDGETDLFPGAVALLAALAAIILRSRIRSRREQSHETSWVLPYACLIAVGALLSLGPQPAFGDRVLFSNPLYPWLSDTIPGFASLRASARFAVIAELGLSVLAAYGVAAFLRWRQTTVRQTAAISAGICALIMAEGLALPNSLIAFPVHQRAGDAQSLAWLAAQPPGAVIELPLDGWGRSHYTMLYQYRVLEHHHPLVVGVSRFDPPLTNTLSDPDSPIMRVDRIPEGVAFLRALGVRYVVIHPARFSDRGFAEALRIAYADAAGQPGQIFGETTIVDLGDVTPARTTRPVSELPASSLTVSTAVGTAERMLDGDPATRWLTGEPQRGDEVIDVTLASTDQVAGVRLQLLGRSFNDYPRELTITVTDSFNQSTNVFAGSVFPAFGAALRLNPSAPVIDLRWEAVAGTRVRLRQTGRTTRKWSWSVHELRILTPFLQR